MLDSCTIILLAKASVLERAAETYKLRITNAVYEEVMAGKEKMFTDALLLDRLEKEQKIKRVDFNTQKMKKIMQDFNMEQGEASVIAKGIEENEIVGTDNRQGRKAAKVYGLSLTGSINLVVALYKKRKITKEKAIEALKILQEQGWFSSYLIEQAKGDLQ